MAEHWGVPGEGRFCIALCPLLDKSAPVEKSPAATSPETKSFNIQTTRMKCHGKFDKNQEGVRLTLWEGGAPSREGEPKGTEHAWLGGRTPSLQRQQVTKGRDHLGSSRLFRGQGEVRVCQTKLSLASRRRILCKTSKRRCPMVCKDQPKSSNASLPSPTWVPQSPEAPWQSSLWPSELWSS